MKDKNDSISPDFDFLPSCFLENSIGHEFQFWLTRSCFNFSSAGDRCIAGNAHGAGGFGGVAACVCAWSHSYISFELKGRLRLSDADSRNRRCRLTMVAMPGKLRMSIVSRLGGGLLTTDSLRALQLPWGASSIRCPVRDH